jgi:two-component system sensor histidine kinase YesM
MWLKKSIFAKLVIGMLLIVIIPFSLSNMISYQTTSRSMEQQIIELNQSSLGIGMDHLKRYLEELNRLSVSFYYDQTLMGYLRLKHITPAHMLYITEQLSNVYFSRPEIRAVQYISAFTGHTFIKSDNQQVGRMDYLPKSAVISNLSQGMAWKESDLYSIETVGKERVLTIHKPIIDYPANTVLGVLSLYIGLDEVRSLIEPLTDRSSGEITALYFRQDRELFFSTGGDLLSGIEGEFELSGKQGSVSGKWNENGGAYVYVQDYFKQIPVTAVKFIHSKAINESANQTLNRSLIIQFAALAFVIVLAALLSYWTIAPIRRLLRVIARVETGNFDVSPPAERMDEIGVLEQRFHTMIRNLDELINKEYRYRLELTTARLKMLQAQINPHFLYNTLQLIGTLALRHKVVAISDKIAELGNIMRYSMDITTETVPLGKEVEHIGHYLALQTGRFRHKLSYTLSCPSDASDVPVPKMILQPIVENSIIHGFEKGKGSGTLHISIALGNQLHIRVMDNGKGIDEDTIERLKNEYGKRQWVPEKESGIGMINVLERLRLYYGDGFSWSMQSKPYELTVISLTLPIDSSDKGGNRDESIDRG